MDHSTCGLFLDISCPPCSTLELLESLQSRDRLVRAANWTGGAIIVARRTSFFAAILSPKPPAADSLLTPRESQVLSHVAFGLSNDEIARSLENSVERVKEHVQDLLRKLAVNDRTRAAVWAVKSGVV